MKIAFLTEMNWRGKVPNGHVNMRTEFCWMYTLGADHFNIHEYEQIKGYDAVFIIFPKATVKLSAIGIEMETPGQDKDISIYTKPVIKTLKKNNGKICNVQEGPSDFFNDYDMPTQFNFYNQLSECDILFAHNKCDIDFYKGLFPQTKIRVIPSLMFPPPTTEPTIKSDKTMIGGNFCKWYGGFQSYVVASTFNCPISVPSMHCKRKGEEGVPNLTHLPYMTWIEWMYVLSNYKYAVHLMPTVAAGTFSMNCLSGDTDIITIDGIKNIKDINIGDYVISKNMTNGESEWKKVINTIKSPKQKTYHVKGRSIDFITTGDHNLIIKKRDGRRNGNIGYKNEFYFEKVINFYKQKNQPKSRRKLPDFSEIKNNIICERKYPIFTVDGASLLGWFISEGNTRDWKKYPSDNRIDIAQRKSVNENNYNEISKLLHRMGYNFREYKDRISFIDKTLKKYLIENIGRLCHIKRIPRECLSWTTEMKRALWLSMMKGDGDKKYTTYTTTSHQLQKDFAILSMTLGIGITLSKPIQQKSDNHHTLYQVYIHKTKGNLLYAKNISEYIEQETFCIEVEDNHNFVAGRNGKFQFIGNCAYFGIPCIGNIKVDTQSTLFPECSVDVNDVFAARSIALQLQKDTDFYDHISHYARRKLNESYHLDSVKWKDYILDILSY